MAQAISIVVAGASIAALATQPAFRNSLVIALGRWTGYNAPGGLWRIAAVLLALANLKNLPFVWHIRFFRALFYQIYLQPTSIPPHALFQPVITSTRTPILEMDYNLHKSNSTYFSDMDISRTHLFTAIIRNGIKKNSRLYGAKKSAVNGAVGATEGTRGKHMIALGGISCLFKREILPYRKYEMWTRLLCWDRKWFYLITHLVKPGVGQPSTWTLQPWKKNKGTVEKLDQERLLGSIYATAIAKYVIKRGRLTVPPEQALMDADMVPIKPEGWVYQGETIGDEPSGLDANEVLPKTVQGENWNWDFIEAERQRGLKVAQKFAEMDGMHEYFDGGRGGVLGEFPDLLF
ncbi:Nn.00g078200.m01.CDS01 [Neocucurbitaria sp. VM-36]